MFEHLSDRAKGNLLEAIFWFLVVACFWLSFCNDARSQTPDPARASYRVWVNNGNGSRSGGSSTGISPHLVVTNAHVVGDASQAEVLHPLLGKRWVGEVVTRDRSCDVALIYIQSGEIEWVNVGSDPEPQSACRLYGYGGDSVLKAGSGRFLHSSMRQSGAPVLQAAVESVSGDSGGGIFDESGNLVSINWGATNGNVSLSTPASYIARNAQRWATDLVSRKPEFTQLFGSGGCWGQCPPQYGGGGYGGGIPPKQPIQIQPPTQPLVPIQPLKPPPVKPAEPEVDLEKLAAAIAAKLPKPVDGKDGLAGPTGPPGLMGPKGDTGPAGPAVTIDLDQLAGAVIARLPPIHVQNYDRLGRLVDEEFYPYPGPIRLKDRPLQYTGPN